MSQECQSTWTENESSQAETFFRAHMKELSQFLLAEGIDKKALLAALEKEEASSALKELVQALEIENQAPTAPTVKTMGKLSAALRAAARKGGVSGDFKSVFAE